MSHGVEPEVDKYFSLSQITQINKWTIFTSKRYFTSNIYILKFDFRIIWFQRLYDFRIFYGYMILESSTVELETSLYR